MPPTFFETAAKFRAWLRKHHQTADELWVGFRKKKTGLASMTRAESVDEALCFGWIDGLGKSIDADSYMVRFTPRRKGSFWSAINTARASELMKAGRMRPAGRKAFAARDSARTTAHTSARRSPRLDDERERLFKASRRAWQFFQSQPPGYRRMVIWWVMSAKREETRDRRFQQLLGLCVAKRRLMPLGPAERNR
jgi:uncharacterized protein YdeI (YjbR/CyaY-like superfamily)